MKNHQLPSELRITDNVTSKWPHAGGATMSRAQTGQIIISNTQYKYKLRCRPNFECQELTN